MGNSCENILKKKKGNFALPQLEQKNQYRKKMFLISENYKQQLQYIMKKLSAKDNDDSYKLASLIQKSQKQQFTDQNFTILEAKELNFVQSRLSVLYDFDRFQISRTFKHQKTDLHELRQNQVQFCYLTSVFYLLCEHVKLKKKIIMTQQANQHHCYLINLFCNGRQTQVVVDDYIPLDGEVMKYLNLGKNKQIWTILLEKAWCKMIGSYLGAKGLSPEDAFQQITGIPAYSYSLQFHPQDLIVDLLSNAIKNDYWVTFTANINNEKNFKSRQVFYLNNYQNQYFFIRSPYFDIKNQYNYDDSLVKMSISQIRQYFEYVTIGYYVPEFSLHSFPLKSKMRQDNLYQLSIAKYQSINIRFIQMFSEYFAGDNIEAYGYSPVIIQLYNYNKQLIERCEGCEKSIQGNRSTNLTPDIFVDLEPGNYYIRIQVDWLNDDILNEGTLVIYSSKDNASLKHLQKDQAKLILPAFIISQFENDKNFIEIQNLYQSLKIRNVEKKFKYLIGIYNTGQGDANLKIIFKNSQNIRVNFHKFELENQVITVNLLLQGLKEQIIEIMAEDPRLPVILEPIQIQRNDKKQNLQKQ